MRVTFPVIVDRKGQGITDEGQPGIDERSAKPRPRLRLGADDLKPQHPSGLEIVNRVLVNARAIGEFLATPP